MAVSPDFLDYVLEQLHPMGGITHKRMFGGVGISRHELFFGLIADDTLYLKVDDDNREAFAAAGSEPFKPFGGDKAMSYWSTPLEALEDPDALGPGQARALKLPPGPRPDRSERKPRALSALIDSLRADGMGSNSKS